MNDSFEIIWSFFRITTTFLLKMCETFQKLISLQTVKTKHENTRNIDLRFRYGTMHVFSTNIILWIRTLIKETIEALEEVEDNQIHKGNSIFNKTVKYC